MNAANFMQNWVVLTGSVAMIALILTTFGLMLGIVKPADAISRVGAILGVVMFLNVFPAVIVSIWSGMSLWQQLGLAVIALGAFLVLQKRRKSKHPHNR